jgi:hypothetical protein
LRAHFRITAVDWAGDVGAANSEASGVPCRLRGWQRPGESEPPWRGPEGWDSGLARDGECIEPRRRRCAGGATVGYMRCCSASQT